MTCKAILWTKNTNKNNTHQILIYCYNNGVKKYYKTGIFIPEENWSIKKEEVKGIPHALKAVYNDKINELKADYRLRMAQGIPANKMDLPDFSDQAKDMILFLSNFINQQTGTIEGLKPGTLKTYKTTLKFLKKYCNNREIEMLSFDAIDMDFYHDFAKFMKTASPGIQGFANKVKVLKRILKIAYQRGLHENKIFENSQFKRNRHKTVGKIYLTEQEIGLLEKLHLSTMPGLDLERDRFLISYYFIQRWEDSTLINKKNFFYDDQNNLTFSYTSQKTKTLAVLPVSIRAQKLLEKRDYSFGGHTNQYANRAIKDIASMAGINKVTQQGGQLAPKFRFITTHTARRSAATNLYLDGMDLQTLSKLGGWSDLQVLRTYLRASGLEIAQNAKNFDFFK